MGADFLSVYCEAPPDDIDPLEAIAARVISLDQKSIDYFAEEVLGEWEGNGKRAIVLQAAIDAYDHVSVLPRDMELMFLCGKKYWLTGGMSWGDPPTDSFDKISLLAELEIDWNDG